MIPTTGFPILVEISLIFPRSEAGIDSPCAMTAASQADEQTTTASTIVQRIGHETLLRRHLIRSQTVSRVETTLTSARALADTPRTAAGHR
jgi:hypothetical protein